MFAKLLKYEWRATSRLLGIISAGILGLGLIGCLFVGYVNSVGFDLMSDSLALLLVMGTFLGAVSLGIYYVAVQVILFVRFYKSKFSDEGYLTFTLPVTPRQLYWSSVVNILIWQVLSLLTVCLTLGLVIAPILLQDGLFHILLSDFSLILNDFGYTGINLAVMVLNNLVSLLCSFAIPLACITAGAVLVKKYKLLAAIGIYYIVNMVTSLITTLLSLPGLLYAINTDSSEFFNASGTLLNSVFMAGVAVAGYFLTIHWMKKKLNLA